MKEVKANKMGSKKVSLLVWEMGIPMILSMILQALYNVVDTVFVINMPEGGNEANLALTYSFPAQILMIAFGVGLGIGINALISKNLGEGDKEGAGRAAGNGIFLGFLFYLIFLLFGLFGAKPFLSMMAHSIPDEATRSLVIEDGSSYLRICCCLSLGQMLFTVYERFLQSTGRTLPSMIGQISGAAVNIALDYVLIYPAGLGVAGAAYATVIGQFVSLFLDMAFHYAMDKEIPNRFSCVAPKKRVIGEIFRIGLPAMIMQALLSLMMFGTNLILGTSSESLTLQGAFGIYYKIQQIALFACFGMSNALISLVAYNDGRRDRQRLREIVFWGITDSLVVALVLVILFEAARGPISRLFGLSAGEEGGEVVSTCRRALLIASPGFLFMAYTVSIQGILQGMREVWTPLILSALRLAVFSFPLTALFLHVGNPVENVWWSFFLAEVFTDAFSFLFLQRAMKKKVGALSLVEEKRESANA